MDTRRDISHIIVIGDSLSDRGTLYEKKLFGFLSLNFFSGLQGRSTEGSFANGFVWSDNIISSLANEFTIQKIKKERMVNNSDIADAVVNGDFYLNKSFRKYYDLQNDEAAKYRGETFFRSYAEGGLTDYNYAGWPSMNVGRFFSRLILPTLAEKRVKINAYDHLHNVTQTMKSETLILEWTGANDLITVNAKPSKSEVDRAVKERIQNAEKLIASGYKNFIMINMPDLSLTPRYQTEKLKDNAIAKKYSDYFNQKLSKGCAKLRSTYPDCKIDIFDVSSLFTQLYNDPETYGFEKDKLTKSYVDTKDFKIQKNGTSPSTGYMFWNDVHPSSDVHALLSDAILDLIHKEYTTISPDHKHTMKRRASMSDLQPRARYQKDEDDSELIIKRTRSF